MPENTTDKTRVVTTVNGVPALAYHQLADDGTKLLIPHINSQTKRVEFWHETSHARYGIDYCEKDEDPNVAIRSSAQTLIDAQHEAGMDTVQDKPIFNESDLAQNVPTWQRLGFKNEEKWRKAGSPQE